MTGSSAPPWPAPRARGPLDATVTMPGSKSMTNRALVLAALAEAPTVVHRPLASRDTALMVDALRALGVAVATSSDAWTVTPGRLTGPATVDAGLAGTVMRFVLPLAALADGPVHVDGDARARERPLRPLLEALRSLGVRVDDDGRGALPVTMHGAGTVEGGEISIDAGASSQLVSALLLAAPAFRRGLTLRHVGGPLPSGPHVEMTLAMLRERGVPVERLGAAGWRVDPSPVAGGDVVVEPDLSSAAAFLAAPLLAGGRVRVTGWPAASLQPGADTPAVLERMGATVRRDGDDLVVSAEGPPRGIDIDLSDNPELACVLAAVAAAATGPSRLTGIAHMRGHETDRLAALATELGALGARVTERRDGLDIAPARLHGGLFRTYDDHRLAMAAAVLGLAVDGVEVENPETTGKTFPGFPEIWDEMVDPAHAGAVDR